jgi:hypothetical protein
MDILMGKGQVGILDKLGVCGFCDELKHLTYLKTGIYQPKMQYAFEVSMYAMIAFFTPFYLVQSQLFVGVIVNMMLISGALYSKGREMLPLIFLPSLAVLSRGLLFGDLTMYLLYMLPFIWIGNAILVYSVKSLYLKKNNDLFKSAAFGSALKAMFLLACAGVLLTAGLVPEDFLMAFGIVQLVTAVAAALIIWPIHNWRTGNKK